MSEKKGEKIESKEVELVDLEEQNADEVKGGSILNLGAKNFIKFNNIASKVQQLNPADLAGTTVMCPW